MDYSFCDVADATFGPQITSSCRTFDFTRLFEEAFLSIAPSTVFLIFASFRASRIFSKQPIVRKGRLHGFKLVSVTRASRAISLLTFNVVGRHHAARGSRGGTTSTGLLHALCEGPDHHGSQCAGHGGDPPDAASVPLGALQSIETIIYSLYLLILHPPSRHSARAYAMDVTTMGGRIRDPTSCHGDQGLNPTLRATDQGTATSTNGPGPLARGVEQCLQSSAVLVVESIVPERL
jgi:hypothetical protein